MRLNWLFVLLQFAVACKADAPRTNTSSSSSTQAVIAGWESASPHHDSNILADKPAAPALDSSYAAALAASTLPDEKTEPRVTLAASDETDVSNYQSAGWWLGYENHGSNPKPPRFSADFARFTSGVLFPKTGHNSRPQPDGTAVRHQAWR